MGYTFGMPLRASVAASAPGRRLAVGILAACLLATGRALAADPIPNQACLDCHEAPPPDQKTKDADANPAIEVMRRAPSAIGPRQAPVRRLPRFDQGDPARRQAAPRRSAPPATPKETHAYATSIHGMSHAMGASGAATCTSCHGDHEIVPVKQLDSPVFKLNLPQTCARCHSNPKLTHEYRIGNPQAAANYRDSIHGQALLKMGLIVAPSCNDCHGVHDIKRSVDQSSRTNHANIANTCGQCHVGIEAVYSQSVHGQLARQGRPAGPRLHRLPQRPPDRRPRRASISRRRATRSAAAATRTGSPTTARPTTARRWPSAGPTSPPTSPPATTATATTTSSRSATRARTCRRRSIVATCQQCHPGRRRQVHRVPAPRRSARRGPLPAPAPRCTWA